MASRSIWASARLAAPRVHAPRLACRNYATKKEPGPTSQFYKTFTRPIAKVLVVAVFTYQVAYWGWVKLETDEIQRDTDAEIADLEAKVSALDKAKHQAPKTDETKTKRWGWW